MKKLFMVASLCLMFGIMFLPAQTVLAQEGTEEPVIKTAHITDPEFRDIAWEMMGSIVDSRIELYATTYDIDWSIPAKKLYSTAYFYKKKDTMVSLNIKTSATAWAGIIDYSGKMSYVEGTKIACNFPISKSNYYCVFVQNNKSYKITASGEYRK